MNTHTQDHLQAALKALADERKDCKSGTPIAPKLAEALRAAIEMAESPDLDGCQSNASLARMRTALAEWDAQS